MNDLLKACIASGQVDSTQIEAHREAGELDMRDRLLNALERAVEAESALRELLDSCLTEIPSYECGKDAQDAWADRRARARNNADLILRRVG